MKLKAKLTFVPGLVLLLSMFAVPVSARNGIDDRTTTSSTSGSTQTSTSGSGSSGSGSSGSGTSGSGSTSTSGSGTELSSSGVPEVEHTKVVTETEKQSENEVETESKSNLEDLAKQHKVKHSADERKKNCRDREHGLETKLANLIKNSQKHLAHVDAVYALALDYQKTSTETPAGFVDLKTAADAAQIKAKASTVVLGSLRVDVDCNNPSAANDVSMFKAAAARSRTDLSNYKDSVKAVLKSLESLKESKQ